MSGWRYLLLGLAVAGCGAAPAADRDCTDFHDQAAAQRALDAYAGDPENLDADGNGTACESLGAAATGAPARSRGARVLTVVDGDTIKVRVEGGARETVRLVGVDTPESKRPETPVECGAERAAAELRRLVAGRSVVLVRDPSQDARDRFGRTLAYVDVGTRDAGQQLVRSGWAKAYVYGGVPFRRVGAYRAAERVARRGRLGVHGACGGDFHR